MISFFLPDAAATQQLGVVLGRTLSAGTVLLLQGDLGSGKTTLTQGIGQGLGITDAIASPTFTLVNEYIEGRIPLYHIDLYRLSSEEATGLYLETYWEGLEYDPGIVVIEWAERLQYLPPHYLQIQFSAGLEGGRRVQFKPVGEVQTDWLTAIKAIA